MMYTHNMEEITIDNLTQLQDEKGPEYVRLLLEYFEAVNTCRRLDMELEGYKLDLAAANETIRNQNEVIESLANLLRNQNDVR